MNNMSWVNGQIAVSGAFADRDILRLKEEGINAIIDIRSENSDNEKLIKKHGIDYLRVKVKDTLSPSFDQLKNVVDFVNPLLDKGRSVLIHCQNGCGRSPLIVVAILAQRGMEISNALQLIRHRHPNCRFTDDQQYFLNNELTKFLKTQEKY